MNHYPNPYKKADNFVKFSLFSTQKGVHMAFSCSLVSDTAYAIA